MATEKPKFTVIVEEDLNKEIEDFMFEQRLRSKSAATVQLIQKGLEKIKEDIAKEKQKEGQPAKVVNAIIREQKKE